MENLDYRFIKNDKIVKTGYMDKLSILHFALKKDIDCVEIGRLCFGISNTPHKFICEEKITEIEKEFNKLNDFCKKVYGVSY